MKAADFDRPLANNALFVDQDDAAKEIAIYFGLANHLNEIPGKGGRFAMYIYAAHPTHWVCCGRWVEQDQGNGYAAWFLPKSELPTLEAAQARLSEVSKRW